ncbi:tRNA-dependent cyclodipeptide synthase [Streptomyces somaliensis DSM 40738]|uniref:Cyclodipeptide synthase n=1 Tax=Streptomyces somaliensis (strain ATCC 33201 / DSM 40738 / JCM 12659 / KCTC 9044 / NCTC 11332 / NRRL B-12077 / IP 733) TaxID=1134445 RepID=A0AA44ICF3_STRE0|nr:tRNA-dependent cyclodipeptide synthase [Streptomyces somaliensis]MCQ0023686.1 tRNA-dependent cyclodipeptide synthase [Streptomyces somaliensis DSM 40738]NKY13118.1 tRNA-dependent cyclodipeptide synthase [Streptomyces somaliensis DSM 40738]
MALDVQGSTSTVTIEKKTRRTRYKTEIAFVSPQSSRHTFEENGSCFLGISLENSNFTTAKLESMVKWISRRFPRCTVLIGDSIHRLTLESMCGLEPEEARRHAVDLGRRFLGQERPVFDAHRHSTDFTFLTCGEVQKQVECDEIREQLDELFASDDAFRGSVESFARSYHTKRSADVDEAERERRVGISCSYFLEEFSVFAFLQRRGLPVMVYPGSFSTLNEIARGEHGNAPRELRDLIVVSLHLKGR